ncbi:MAG: hypothetical protein ACLP8B_12425 [Xanthobacteraceae bacterium]|jgi:hypothetical protein
MPHRHTSIALPRQVRRLQGEATSPKTEDLLHLAALYGALALIAGVVLGTLSFHPF